MKSSIQDRHENPNVQYLAPRMVVTVILTICMVYCSFGCKADVDNWITVAGIVVERGTHIPIDSAWVSLGDTLRANSRVYTDTSGQFIILTIPFREIDIYAGRIGYRTLHEVVKSTASNITALTLELETASSTQRRK